MGARLGMVHTTGASQRLATRLAMADGRFVPMEALLLAVYGADEPFDAASSVRVMLSRLKARLPEGALRNVRGVGYALDPAAAKSLPEVDDRILVPAIQGDAA
jgi:DNA-binding response OmpR family regulator